MTHIATFLPDLEPDCTEIITELAVVMKLLEQGMQTTDLHKHLDLFYYIERSTKMKLLIRNLKGSSNPDLVKFKELKDVYAAFKLRWQNDYKFIVTPKSLHAFLLNR
jgi:hypothetical protein